MSGYTQHSRSWRDYPVKRAISVLSCAAVLIALLPTTASAAAASRYSDHSVEASCDGSVEGGYASVFVATSTHFGDGANVDVWLDPAVPFEDQQSMSGSGGTVDRVEDSTEFTLTSTVDVFDPDGTQLGAAVATATMTRLGEPEIIGPELGKSNQQSMTTGTRQELAGSATLDLPGLAMSEIVCSGMVTDVDVFQTNPHAFVSSDQGVTMDCFWQSDDTIASFFATNGAFGFFADAGLSKPDVDISGSSDSGSLTATSLAATIPLIDFNTGDPRAAIASATFTHIGNPYTSALIVQGGRTKSTQQALAAHGTLAFDTGNSFEMDAAHCRANSFDTHSQANVTSGPKPGAAPANDAPDGAIHLTSRSKPNLLTGSTALEAEVPNLTCPSGERDAMGHTVWYTVTGTGGPITIDTSGSDFDTVAAVFAPDGEGLTEIACDDDVEFVPIGASYQAVVTFDSDAGVEYFIEVGGYANFFTGDA